MTTPEIDLKKVAASFMEAMMNPDEGDAGGDDYKSDDVYEADGDIRFDARSVILQRMEDNDPDSHAWLETRIDGPDGWRIIFDLWDEHPSMFRCGRELLALVEMTAREWLTKAATLTHPNDHEAKVIEAMHTFALVQSMDGDDSDLH